MVKTTKIIIGANYGDEGKGLATAHFSLEAKVAEQRCLNILFNGGPQRGHTVEIDNTFSHVFHHFGSGSIYGAGTYFDEPFMVNPKAFAPEYAELGERDISLEPKCFINPNCRITTPYDEIINQIVELSRGGKKHGSCGYGIWETQKRYEEGTFNLLYKDLKELSVEDFLKYLKDIRLIYLPKRLLFYGIKREMIPEDYKFIFDSKVCDKIDLHYLNDFCFMSEKCECKRFEDLVSLYDYFVYEGAQGLALDADNVPMKPYVTASKTGAKFAVERIRPYTSDIEVIYVSRTYFTRHGAGPFPTECNREELGGVGEDLTNKPNNWQDSIRYGKFDFKEFSKRVKKDISSFNIETKVGVMLTHCNEIKPNLGEIDWFDKLYLSKTPDARDILEFEL